MTMWMKNPNKIKTVTSINGQEMIQVFDGVKGYTVNPMTGSTCTCGDDYRRDKTDYQKQYVPELYG